jgi:hypothetical protein
MVSLRCKMVVKAALEQMGLSHGIVELGEVQIKEKLSPAQREQLKATLANSGLELMDDKKAMLIEKIKNIVIDQPHLQELRPQRSRADRAGAGV